MPPMVAYMARKRAVATALLFASSSSSRAVTATTRIMRHFLSTTAESMRMSDAYKAIVVGAGPAGIAVVGNLLENGVKPVAWVDERFEGGRLNDRYREVPSNTKTKLFLAFADALAPFRQIISKQSKLTSKPTAYQTLETLAQDKGCQISYAADLCLQLTRGLADSGDVHLVQGAAKSATRDSKSSNWQMSFKDGEDTTTAPMLVLCTGAHPKPPKLPEQYPNLTPLDLDTALSPTKLAAYFADTSKPTTVALIGASHSAILVLRNLYELASGLHPNLSVKWFSRHPLRYAEDKGDWILRDNTGLKGDTAIWAKANLEPEVWTTSEVSKYVQAIDCKSDESGQYTTHLPSCTNIVEAVGFDKNNMPELLIEQSKVDVIYDNTSGGFKDQKGNIVKGLYGAGIAFPERVKDPAGNVEYAVGMWKFMRYLRRVVPAWT